MKQRILNAMNKILENETLKDDFKIVNAEENSNYKEISFRFGIDLKYKEDKKFKILFLQGDLNEISEDELIGCLVHELAHFFSPPTSLKEKKLNLFSELQRHIEKQMKIGGSRFLKPLEKKRDELIEEIGGMEGLNQCVKIYRAEEDATDKRAIDWGFEKEIKTIRENDEANFMFRFVRL